MTDFQKEILEGIPQDRLPEAKPYEAKINHAPKRKDILSQEQKALALKNALRYFPAKFHETLAPEFAKELKDYGRIYMYRFRPSYEIYARPIDQYPCKCRQAAAIMAMIQNNLDPRVAQHPHELIIYGGNGAIFQNWAQYRLTMKYLAEMTQEQTLAMYSGHPMGLFPSRKDAPRVVVTNGMVIPNYSSKDDYERFNAMGVSQYGQMTAGSYMYIGPQGITPIAIQSILMSGAQIVSTLIVAPLGNIAIATNSFAITAESLCYMPGFGIGDAATTLVGQTYGANRMDLCKNFAHMTVGLGMVVMTFMGAVMYIFAPEMIGLLSPVEEIRVLGTEVLRIEAFAEPFFAAAIVTAAVCVGVGDTLKPAIINLVSMWMVRLTLAYWLSQSMGLKGVWIAMAIELTFRGILFLIRLFRGKFAKH